MNQNQVLDLIRRALAKRHPQGATIEIIEDGIRQEGNWWHVPVRPDRDIPRTYEYYEVLTDVEDEVQHEFEDDTEVLLVPSS